MQSHPPEKSIRTFIAIPLPDKEKQSVFKKINEFQHLPNAKLINWTKKEKLHLTLRFLGQIPEKKISGLIEELENILNDFPGFTLQPSQFILLPKRHPRTLVISFLLSEPLSNLCQRIDTVLKALHLRRESRPLLPHITVARKKTFSLKDFEKQPCPLVEPVFVDRVILYKSQLDNKGSHYSVLKEFFLVSTGDDG